MRYQVPLLSKENIAQNTLLLRFRKPKEFDFKPGQFVQISLPEYIISDDRGNSRDISLASAPFEEDLMIAVRLRDSSFKKGLNNLSLGEHITIKSAMGPFLLHEDMTKPAVFIAGGIGVTPFRSMLLHNLHHNLAYKTVLFYSCKNNEDGVFLNELREIENKNSNHTNIFLFTDPIKKIIGNGESGRLNISIFKKYLTDVNTAQFYLAGPLHMVKAVERMLEEMGIERERVVLDYFTGYEQSVRGV